MRADGALFFATPAAFRAWLERHHQSASELWVGFHRKGSGSASITWPESVAEALCYGWIDGVRQSIDDTRYRIRFTPRRPRSNWSAVNLKLAQELLAAGRMQPAGRAAYEQRDPAKQQRYSFEREHIALPPAYLAILQQDRRAWAHFQAQSPYYQRQVSWWIMSAKREDTRTRRLQTLIESSAAGERVPPLRR